MEEETMNDRLFRTILKKRYEAEIEDAKLQDRMHTVTMSYGDSRTP